MNPGVAGDVVVVGAVDWDCGGWDGEGWAAAGAWPLSSANALRPAIAEKLHASSVDPSSAKPNSAPLLGLQTFPCFADLVIPAVAFEAQNWNGSASEYPHDHDKANHNAGGGQGRPHSEPLLDNGAGAGAVAVEQKAL